MTDAATTAPAPIGHNAKPRRTWKGAPRACMECGSSFNPTHPKGMFCQPSHQVAFHNRNGKRGRVAIPLAQAWRAPRGSKDPAARATAKTALGQLCRLIDQYNREDREAGRPSAVAYITRKERLGYLS